MTLTNSLKILTLALEHSDFQTLVVDWPKRQNAPYSNDSNLGFSDMGRLYEIYAAHIAFERGIRNDTPM
ncbi:hypothetical protein PPACK8108_LOCUS6823 [Phakopsora pachyrhizi]|uniref:Uncharacterized protein n=1 Tax=Phakopsora pachyrhizi TaxID=170000 RepID=A0AAV0AVX6_PHAPC|nr:hypothetical protein PPACK8108_LOCUS6823 [Phakopsora pachyrhizi]